MRSLIAGIAAISGKQNMINFGIVELDSKNKNSFQPLRVLSYNDCFEIVQLHDKFAIVELPQILRNMLHDYNNFMDSYVAVKYAKNGVIFNAPIELSEEDSADVLIYLRQMFPGQFFYRYEMGDKEIIRWQD